VGDAPVNDAPHRLLTDVDLGKNVVIQAFTNLYGCRIGDNTRVGTFVEIQQGVVIGANCKISSHSFICSGVEIRDDAFIGHGVMFINDKVAGRRRLDTARNRRRPWGVHRLRRGCARWHSHRRRCAGRGGRCRDA
jgi:carbonic anhydrase/acetyltransferase-like protein (isoleucine patch superfamily)